MSTSAVQETTGAGVEYGILDRIIAETSLTPDDEAYGIAKRGISAFIEELLKPQNQGEQVKKALVDRMIAEIDAKLSQQMDEILHHAEFQALESSWRGLKLLIDRTNFRENIKVEILNVSKQDLLDDFEDSPEVVQSGLYKHIYTAEYGQFGGQPVGAIVANYYFSPSTPDVKTMQYVASRLIAQYESEWYADEGLSKWEALNCYMTKESERDWESEKKRIRELIFWKEANFENNSKDPRHINPIPLIANYGNKNELIIVEKFIEIYTPLHPTFNNTSSLGDTSKENLKEIIKNINKYYSEHNEKPNRYELAYMLATARHEMYHFPTGEYFSKNPEVGDYHYFDKYDPVLAATPQKRQNAIDHENTVEGDGFKYRGRGPVHLTWKVNYRRAMEKFGPDFVNNPDLAADFENSVPIMIWGMKTGIFTGKSIGDYINSTTIDYEGARKVINGVDQKVLIASYAKKFEDILKDSSTAPTDF